jgi:hypothetical protein
MIHYGFALVLEDPRLVYIYLTSSIVVAMNSSDDRRRQVDVHQACGHLD